MSIKLRGAAVALVLLPILAACGSGGDAGGATPPQDLNAETLNEGLSGEALTFTCAGCSGSDLEAKQSTFGASFGEETGADVTVQIDDCGITKLQGMVQANNVSSDIWQFCTKSDYLEAIDQGLLEQIDPELVGFNGLVEDTYTEYGLDATPYTEGLLYNADAYKDNEPTSTTDVFDLETFPGKRCILTNPQYNGTFEAASIQSGKSPDEVYPLDMDAIYSELDKIRDEIVFVSSGAEATQNLLNGTCTMTMRAQGDALDLAQQNPDFNVGYAIDSAMLGSSPIGIPKGAKNAQASAALVRWFVTNPDWQSAYINEVAYMPAFFKTPPAVSAEAEPYVLTEEDLSIVVPQDDTWWAENTASATEQWNAWLAQ